MEKPNLPINFERAANLMDVVQKVATVAPTYTALSSVAMMELKEYNEAAQAYLNELGQQRLEAEQEAAATLKAQSEEVNIDQETDTPQFPDEPDHTPITRRV